MLWPRKVFFLFFPLEISFIFLPGGVFILIFWSGNSFFCQIYTRFKKEQKTKKISTWFPRPERNWEKDPSLPKGEENSLKLKFG